MKVIQGEPIIVAHKEAYEAFDGTVFEQAWKCKRYEEDTMLSEMYKNIEHLDYNCWLPPDGHEHGDDNAYYWFKPKNENDIKLLNKYLEIVMCDFYEAFGADDIGKWCCIEVSEGDAWFSNLDFAIDYFSKFIADFGYEMKLEPKTEEKK